VTTGVAANAMSIWIDGESFDLGGRITDGGVNGKYGNFVIGAGHDSLGKSASGSGGSTYKGFLQSEIDDLRIYDRALSQAEVSALYRLEMPISAIYGQKYHDLDGDGLRDAGEPGLSGWTIYLDANGNGLLDPGEVNATTRSDDPATSEVDESGDYSFVDLPEGTYEVTEMPQSGWFQESPKSPGFRDEMAITTYATHELVSADLNGDGVADLVGVDRTNDLMRVILGDGNGSFATPVSYAVENFPEFLDLGDLDGDGDVDVAVSNAYGGSMSVFLNTGNGTFPAATQYTLSHHLQDVELTDLDGDGDLDAVAVARGNDSGGRGDDRVWLLTND
jgi:hypothetical protein